MFDDLFQILMLLAVVGTSVFRFFKGRRINKIRAQLAAVGPLINASVDPNQRSISGTIEEIPFRVKYEPALEKSPARIDVVFSKNLPFTLEVAARETPFDSETANRSGEFLMDQRKFDEQFSIATNDPDACREYLMDPLFNQGVELVLSQGYCIRYTRRRAVFATPDIEWLADSQKAAASMEHLLMLAYSLIAEFEDTPDS